jgi:hypothetical protein
VETHLVEPRNAIRDERDQDLEGAPGGDNAQRAADEAEDQALGHHLRKELTPSGPDRCADRHLSSSRSGAGQQQVRDIRARDQQDQAHRSEQQLQPRPHRCHELVLHRHSLGPFHQRRALPILIFERREPGCKLEVDSAKNSVDLALGLRGRDAWREPAEDRVGVVAVR